MLGAGAFRKARGLNDSDLIWNSDLIWKFFELKPIIPQALGMSHRMHAQPTHEDSPHPSWVTHGPGRGSQSGTRPQARSQKSKLLRMSEVVKRITVPMMPVGVLVSLPK